MGRYKERVRCRNCNSHCKNGWVSTCGQGDRDSQRDQQDCSAYIGHDQSENCCQNCNTALQAPDRPAIEQKNNLESNLSYLRYAYENLSKSESVIRDADIADEMTQFTRNQIMMDTTMAMLAQANQRPQSVLQLLQ